jgi:hypothetical protein
VTIIAKHTARKPLSVANATDAQARARNTQLRERFPPRPAQQWWPHTAQTLEETFRRLTSPPYLPEVKATRAGRRRGVFKLLRWLSSFPAAPGRSVGWPAGLRTIRGPAGQAFHWGGCVSAASLPPMTRRTCRRAC